MKNLIYRHSNGFLNYTIVLTKSVILLGLQNAPRCKPLSKFVSSILSAVKTGLQSYCNTSYSMSVVNLMWILQICTYNLDPSPPAIALKHLTWAWNKRYHRYR